MPETIEELEARLKELKKIKALEDSKNKVAEYLNTYSGKELYRKYKPTQKGLWEVLGEDPNCDLGGHHYQPKLGYFSGKLENVVRHAVILPKFWVWGGGGTINLISNITEVD